MNLGFLSFFFFLFHRFFICFLSQFFQKYRILLALSSYSSVSFLLFLFRNCLPFLSFFFLPSTFLPQNHINIIKKKLSYITFFPIPFPSFLPSLPPYLTYYYYLLPILNITFFTPTFPPSKLVSSILSLPPSFPSHSITFVILSGDGRASDHHHHHHHRHHSSSHRTAARHGFNELTPSLQPRWLTTRVGSLEVTPASQSVSWGHLPRC